MSTDITLRVRGDDDGARRKLGDLQRTLERLNGTKSKATVDVDTRRATTGLTLVSRGLDNLERRAGRAALTMGRIGGTAVLAGATATSAAVVKLGLDYVRLQESSSIAFTTMLKDGKRARQFMQELTAFAAKTPFELPGLVDSAQRLLAFGWEAKRVIPDLTAIGDAVAGLGGSPEKLDRVILAIGQIRAKGKVQAGEMLQLTENGIAAWDMLAKHMGKSTAEVMKLSEKGAIDSDTAITALITGMNQRFGGMMAKQSRTINGLYSTMMDNARKFSGTFMGAFVPGIKGALDRAGQELNKPANLRMAQTAGRKMANLVNDELRIIGSDREVGDKLALMWERFDQTGAPDAVREAITQGIIQAAQAGPSIFVEAFKAAPWPAKAVIAAMLLNRFGPGVTLAGKALGKTLGRAGVGGGAGTGGNPLTTAAAGRAGAVPVIVTNPGFAGGPGGGPGGMPVPGGPGRGGRAPGGRIPGGFGSPYPGPVARGPGRLATWGGRASRVGVGALGLAGVPAFAMPVAAPLAGGAAAMAGTIGLGYGAHRLAESGKLGFLGFPSKEEGRRRTRELMDAQIAAWKQGEAEFKRVVTDANPFANIGGKLDAEVPKIKAGLAKLQAGILETSPKTRASAKRMAEAVTLQLATIPPAARRIGSETAITMTAELERKGSVAKGTTRRLVANMKAAFGELPTAARKAATDANFELGKIGQGLDGISGKAVTAASNIRSIISQAADAGRSYQTIKNQSYSTGGIVPGRYMGVDTVNARLAPGERILRPDMVADLDARLQGPGVDSTILGMGGRFGGGSFASGGWVYPAPGTSKGGGPGGGTHSRTSGKKHPYLWQDDDAYDLMGSEDGKVIAPHAGTIGAIRPHSNEPGFWGQGVYLNVPGGQFFLKHLKTVSVASGQHVEAGQVIGTLGGSGGKLNGGPHLHIAANPISLLYKAVGGQHVAGRDAAETSDGHGRESELSDMDKMLAVTRAGGLANRRNIGAVAGRQLMDITTGVVGRPGTTSTTKVKSPILGRSSGVAVARDLMSDTPDLSGTIETGPGGRASYGIRKAGSNAAARARAAGKKPEDVAADRKAAEDAELRKFYQQQKRVAARRVRQCQAEIRRLTRIQKEVKDGKRGTKAGRARLWTALQAEINDWRRELGEVLDVLAAINESLLDLDDQAADDGYTKSTLEAGGTGEGSTPAADEVAAAERARADVLQARSDASGRILRGIAGTRDIDPSAPGGITVNVNVGGTLVTQNDVAGWLVGTLGNQPGSRRAVAAVG